MSILIWLNRSPTYRGNGTECTNPRAPLTDIPFSISDTDVEEVQKCVLKQVPSLHIQQCASQKWLVCAPAGSGQLVVLDSQAKSVLDTFIFPTNLTHARFYLSNLASEAIGTTVALFYKLGFLSNIDIPVTPTIEEARVLTAWLHITNACNLCCSYCYVHKTQQNMSTDIAHNAVDAIFRSAIKHNFHNILLKYAGGEASLHMAQVIGTHDYALTLAQKYNIKLEAVLLTNGVVLPQKVITTLKDRSIDIMISLDGLESYHDSMRTFKNGKGSFKYVVGTIERLLTNGMLPHIAVTVSRHNLDGLPELIQFIIKHDMPFTLNYVRANEATFNKEDFLMEEEQITTAMQAVFKVIEQSLPRRCLLGCLVDKAELGIRHRHTCGVGRSYLAVDQKGGIAKCHADIEQTITNIEAEDPLQIIIRDVNGIQGNSVEEKKACQVCEWRYWCTGGCPLVTYKVMGRTDVKSPNCSIYKALFPQVLQLEAQRLLKYEPALIL
jgi:uncharacterized protein